MSAEVLTVSAVDPPDLLGLIREWLGTTFDDNWISWVAAVLILWAQWMLFFWGFYDAYRSTRKIRKRFWSTLRSAIKLRIRHLRKLTLPQRLILVFVGLFGIAVQAFWSIATFIAACVMVELARVNLGGRESSGIEFIEWNWFTGAYTSVCILLLLSTYVGAIYTEVDYVSAISKGEVLLQALFAVILPAIIGLVTGFLAMLATLLYALYALLSWIFTLGDNWGENEWLEIGGAWIVPIGALLYVALTFGSFRTAAATVKIWRPSRAAVLRDLIM